jgi:hypothetical protein
MIENVKKASIFFIGENGTTEYAFYFLAAFLQGIGKVRHR